MTDIRRRNMVVGLGTIVFGTSGFLASGAFEVGSQGSAGSNWIRVEGTDVALDPDGGAGDVSPDSGTDDDGSDEADDDSDDSDEADDDGDQSGSSDDDESEEDELAEEELDDEEIEEELEEVYTLSIRRQGNGSFSVSPSSPFTNQGTNIPYRAGTDVTLRARADEGHVFVGWSGDVAGTDSRQISVTMDRDRRITGRFEPTEEELGEEELEEDDLEEEADEEGDDGDEEEDDGDDGDDDDGGSGSGSPSPSPPDDDADPEEPTTVQVVTDPFNDGNLLTRGSHRWDGTMSGSDLVESDGNGFFTGFSVDDANRNAISRIGIVDGTGVPTDRFAFLVSNVGNPDSPGVGGRPVDLRVDLLDGDGSVLGSTPQLNFPYRIVTADGSTVGSGPDLLNETVRLSVPNVVEVAIEIDSRTGTEDVERVAAVRFSADPAGGS